MTTGTGGTGGSTCVDGQYQSSPTCGWAKEIDDQGNIQDISYVL